MTDTIARPSSFPWPPLIYVAAIAASILLHILLELPWVPSPLSDLLFALGWLCVAAGVALLFSSLRTLRRAKTTAAPTRSATHLVTDGPFGISRNPIYLGNTIVMIGIGLISGMLWFIILAPVAAFATQKAAVEPEERHLEQKFGKRYRDYVKKVRRWI